jgi:four helix bundle protein
MDRSRYEHLVRSRTACAANCAAARGAESWNDIIPKLGIVRKELNETLVWLDLVAKRGMVSDEAVSPARQVSRATSFPSIGVRSFPTL